MQGRRKGLVQGIAEERIRILFRLAEEFKGKNPELSKKYIELALRIAMRNKAQIPQELKLKFCKNCKSFLDEKNSSVGRKEKMLIVKCKECSFERKIKAE
jgi:ribonuclease P protein subunit RPR2